MKYTSRLLEEAVAEFSRFPGIGKKSALRMVLHLLKQEPQRIQHLSELISRLTVDLQHCNQCFALSEDPLCAICSNASRDDSVICVVEDIRDIMAIENTGHFSGKYHVLGGLLNPIDGIGPSQIRISELEERIHQSNIKEIILALSPTVEGDTTIFFISRKLENKGIKMTTISRGVSVGGALEYADEVTLGRSIASRIPV